jgi:CheY-like chemotaxis protein
LVGGYWQEANMGRAFRVLVVEDEAYVALDILAELRSHGITVVGPTASSDEALALIGRETIDAAVLDVKLGDGDCTAVADALNERGVPFLLLTGYGAERVPERHQNRPLINKPYPTILLLNTLNSLTG